MRRPLWIIALIFAITHSVSFAASDTLKQKARTNSSQRPLTATTTRPPSPPSTLPPGEVAFVPLTRAFIAMLNDERRYNRFSTPTQYRGATNLSISLYIEGISSFSAQTMDFHLDMYFYQEWVDQRLAHNSTGPMLIRDQSIFQKLWHPDLYFANARQASFQEVTERNFLVWIYPDGRVWSDCRISLISICTMDLWKYPLDSQICDLRILSYAYPESQLRLTWSTTLDPISYNQDIRMPDMRLVEIKTGTCNGSYATGVWSCMTAVFYVQREMMHHIIQTYVPTPLIVVISWFNFWLDIDSAPARVSLSITTLLTISTQANAVKLSLPEVSYMKAIDFWLGACMTFVFAVMVEYTVAHHAKNKEMQAARTHPNLLVDSTFSTLFGGLTNTTSAGTAANNVGPLVNRRHRTTSQQVTSLLHNRAAAMAHSVSDPHRTLRADEPDIHVIRRPHFDQDEEDEFIVGDGDLDGEEEEDEEGMTGYEEEELSARKTSFVSTASLHHPNNGGGRLYSQPQHNNSFILGENSATQLARLRVPTETALTGGSEKFILLEPSSGGGGGGGRRRPYFRVSSVARLKNQVTRRAQHMKESFHNLRGSEMANQIDKKSRTLFPLAFMIFNIGYWSFYLILT